MTNRLLPDVGDLLSPTGLLYVVILPHNKPGGRTNVILYSRAYIILAVKFTGEVCSILDTQGFKHEVVLQRRAQNEKLFVYRFFRSNNTDLT